MLNTSKMTMKMIHSYKLWTFVYNFYYWFTYDSNGWYQTDNTAQYAV